MCSEPSPAAGVVAVHAVEPLVRDTIGWSRPPPKGRNGRRITSRSPSKDNSKAAADAAVTWAPGGNAIAGGELPPSATDRSSGNSTTSTSNTVQVGAGAAEVAVAGQERDNADEEVPSPTSWEDGPFDLDDAWEAPAVAAGRAERRAVFEGLLPPLGWSSHNDKHHNQRHGDDGDASSQQQQQQQPVGSYIDGLAARHTLLRVALAALVAGVGYDARARTAMQNLAQAAKVRRLRNTHFLENLK